MVGSCHAADALRNWSGDPGNAPEASSAAAANNRTFLGANCAILDSRAMRAVARKEV